MTNNSVEPIMKKALGQDWDKLAPVIKSHYNIAPGTDSQVAMQGTMDRIDHSIIAKLFLITSRIFGALVPYKGKNIKSEVRNWTNRQNNTSMFWLRTFHFPNRSPFTFSSRMEYYGDHEIIEYVRFGMGLQMNVSVQNGNLIYKSIGYRWKLGGFEIFIPNWALLGDAEIVEKSISDKEFYVDFKIVHPLYGQTYSYSGTYSIPNP